MLSFKEFLEEQQNIDENAIGALLKYGGKAAETGKKIGTNLRNMWHVATDPPAKAAARNVSAKGKDAVYDYTMNSTSLNTALVNRARGAGLQSIVQKVVKPHWSLPSSVVTRRVRNLDTAIKDSKLSKDTDLFHGTNLNPHKMGKTSGRNVNVPSYLSTSRSGDEALVRANTKTGFLQPPHVIKIKGKAGQKAHDTTGQTRYSSEKEVILPRNTELKIADKPRKLPRDWSNLLNQPRRTRVWDAEIVSQGKRVAPSPNKVSVSRVASDLATKPPAVVAASAAAGGTGYIVKKANDAHQAAVARQDAWIREFDKATPERRQQMADEWAVRNDRPKLVLNKRK